LVRGRWGVYQVQGKGFTVHSKRDIYGERGEGLDKTISSKTKTKRRRWRAIWPEITEGKGGVFSIIFNGSGAGAREEQHTGAEASGKKGEEDPFQRDDVRAATTKKKVQRRKTR